MNLYLNRKTLTLNILVKKDLFYKSYLVLTFLLGSKIALSQSGWFIRPSIAVGEYSLINNLSFESNRIPSKLAINMKSGFDLGFQLSDEKKGLFSLTSGIYYQPIKIIFQNNAKEPEGKLWYKDILSFKYLNVPLKIEFALSEQKKICPIFFAGLDLNFLIHYKKVNEVYFDNSTRTETIEGNSIDLKYKLIPDTITENLGRVQQIDKWYYRKFVLGLIFGGGIKYQINKRLNLMILANCAAGITDTENKQMIKHSETVDGVEYSLTYNPYQKSQSLKSIGASRNLIVGVQVGVSYLFIKGFRVSLN